MGGVSLIHCYPAFFGIFYICLSLQSPLMAAINVTPAANRVVLGEDIPPMQVPSRTLISSSATPLKLLPSSASNIT